MKERIRAIQRAVGSTDDGDIGPNTLDALERVLGIDTAPKVQEWPEPDFASMTVFYGPVGQRQALLTLPYPMRLAWEPETVVHRISCHELCAEAFGGIFKATLAHYGTDEIKRLGRDLFGGCLNVRKMRGGTEWSKHAWGAAIDIDPERNQLKWGKDCAELAKPEYDEFWHIVESFGGYSLGRRENRDCMHFQLTS